MFQVLASRFNKYSLPGLAMMIVGLSASSGVTHSQTRTPASEVTLEIVLSGAPNPLIRLSSSSGVLLRRPRLKINDPSAAGEFTAVDVRALREADGVKVTVSLIYNDLSNEDWWKDKKEQLVGSYLIRAGETVRTLELNQFGIEPFELRGIDGGPVVLKPGEGPRIINNSTALEVARLERRVDTYQIVLKNISNKNVVAYTISAGNHSRSSSIGSRGVPLIAAGATTRGDYLHAPDAERDGITISNVIFDDGTFEGDPASAAGFLARADGLRIQAPSVLLKIAETLAADDNDFVASFDKTEAELWLIPEAIDKQSAIDYLKVRFPSFDEKMWSALYEELKGGLYDARNIALSEMGINRRMIKERQHQNEDRGYGVKLLRETLERVKETLERIAAGKL